MSSVFTWFYFQYSPDVIFNWNILRKIGLLEVYRNSFFFQVYINTNSSYIGFCFCSSFSQFPKCKFLCVKFSPEELISYWSMEWYLAEKALHQDFSSRVCDLKKTTRRLQHWYGERRVENLKLEEPEKDEITIKVVKPNLLAQVDYKVEI